MKIFGSNCLFGRRNRRYPRDQYRPARPKWRWPHRRKANLRSRSAGAFRMPELPNERADFPVSHEVSSMVETVIGRLKAEAFAIRSREAILKNQLWVVFGIRDPRRNSNRTWPIAAGETRGRRDIPAARSASSSDSGKRRRVTLIRNLDPRVTRPVAFDHSEQRRYMGRMQPDAARDSASQPTQTSAPRTVRPTAFARSGPAI
jgi:hypothetical protein